MNRLNSISLLFQVVLILLLMLSMGIGILIWHAPIPADELTPAQTNLIDVSDGMVKITLGAILGVIGASRIARSNSGGASQ